MNLSNGAVHILGSVYVHNILSMALGDQRHPDKTHWMSSDSQIQPIQRGNTAAAIKYAMSGMQVSTRCFYRKLLWSKKSKPVNVYSPSRLSNVQYTLSMSAILLWNLCNGWCVFCNSLVEFHLITWAESDRDPLITWAESDRDPLITWAESDRDPLITWAESDRDIPLHLFWVFYSMEFEELPVMCILTQERCRNRRCFSNM